MCTHKIWVHIGGLAEIWDTEFSSVSDEKVNFSVNKRIDILIICELAFSYIL